MTMPPFPPLPPVYDFTPRGQAESLTAYRFRALQYFLDFAVVDSMTDEDLEQADSAALAAVVAKGISDRALEILSSARYRILALLASRRAAAKTSTVPGGTAPGKDNLGPMARLIPAPQVQPPSGSHAESPYVVPRREVMDVDIQF